MLKSGSMEDLPFGNTFWHSKSNIAVCAFNFLLKILLYSLQHALSSLIPLWISTFIWHLSCIYDNTVFPFSQHFSHPINDILKKPVFSHKIKVLHIYKVQNSSYLHQVVSHFFFIAFNSSIFIISSSWLFFYSNKFLEESSP
jgi:hypothetical protein